MLLRRRAGKALLASTLLAALASCTGAAPSADRAPDVFQHGVASGDPLSDRVILWTRVSPPAGNRQGPVLVRWRLARDVGMEDPVAWGSVTTGPRRDFTVKIDAVGLVSGQTYYYQFAANENASPVGRTRTLPEGPVERVRLAFASCANYPQGYFNAYRGIAARADLDAVLHLGDYFYEYADGVYGDGSRLGRSPDPPREVVTLADYRTRHAQYKSDRDLQELHRQHPVIAIWDDHESANDSWRGGAQNHDPDQGEGEWAARKAAAVRAYLEWMPVRETGARDEAGRIYRHFAFGDLVDLVMLDTRLAGRDQPAARGDLESIDDPARTLLGDAQEAWFLGTLSASAERGATWRVVGQQVLFSPLALAGERVNPDAWDGYRASRRRVLDHLERNRIDNVILLTGDIHSSWAFDVPRDPYDPAAFDPASGRGSLAVEFVAPAISSSALGQIDGLAERFRDIQQTRPHLRFVNLVERGYGVLDLDRRRAQAEWYFTRTVDEPTSDERFGAAPCHRGGTEPAPARGRAQHPATRPAATRPVAAPPGEL